MMAPSSFATRYRCTIPRPAMENPRSQRADRHLPTEVTFCVQGVISPLLANLYLHPLDLLMEESGYRMVRYADDFVVLCRTADEALDAFRLIEAWVTANGLVIHPDKTRIGDCREPGAESDRIRPPIPI